jgi:hypothetical protein
MRQFGLRFVSDCIDDEGNTHYRPLGLRFTTPIKLRQFFDEVDDFDDKDIASGLLLAITSSLLDCLIMSRDR